MPKKKRPPKRRVIQQTMACPWCMNVKAMKLRLTIERDGLRIDGRCEACQRPDAVWATQARDRTAMFVARLVSMLVMNQVQFSTVLSDDPTATAAWARMLHKEAMRPAMLDRLKPALRFAKPAKKKRVCR